VSTIASKTRPKVSGAGVLCGAGSDGFGAVGCHNFDTRLVGGFFGFGELTVKGGEFWVQLGCSK
jgi:hypothetical protein